MDDLLLSTSSRRQLEQVSTKASHALLLVGKAGSGKHFLALRLAASILNLTPQKLENYPYFALIKAHKQSLGIDAIRDAQSFLHLKTTGTSATRRVVLIEDAHYMTDEAQNALLKHLEEPPIDTVIILTADRSEALLPTVLSRVLKVSIQSPTLVDAIQYFSTVAKEPDIKKAYLLTDGRVGEMTALLHNQTDNELVAHLEQAKLFINMSAYERLLKLDDLLALGSSLNKFLYGLKQIAKTGLKQSGTNMNSKTTSRWHRILAQVHAAEQALLVRANPKLVMTKLLLNL